MRLGYRPAQFKGKSTEYPSWIRDESSWILQAAPVPRGPAARRAVPRGGSRRLLLVTGLEGGEGVPAGGKGVLEVGRQGGDTGEFLAEGVAVGLGEGGVAAFQRAAGAQVRSGSAGAQRFRVVVDAGDVGSGVNGRVVPVHQPLHPARISGDLPGEPCALGEGSEPGDGFRCARPGQAVVLVLVDHGQQVLATGDGLLAPHLSTEAAAAGPGIAFEHLDGVVTVL